MFTRQKLQESCNELSKPIAHLFLIYKTKKHVLKSEIDELLQLWKSCYWDDVFYHHLFKYETLNKGGFDQFQRVPHQVR